MLNWLNNTSIGFRVYVLVGAAFIGVAAIYGAYWMSNNDVEQSREISEYYNDLSARVARTEVEMLQIRRHEKDFLLRLDDQYVEYYTKSSNEAEDLVTSLIIDTLDERVRSVLVSLKTTILSHREQFSDVVSMQRTLGYNENDGLQGTLRAAVHDVETMLTESAPDNDGLWRLMLMMRRHEKDFIMRVDSKYIDRINARRDEFKAMLNRAALGGEVTGTINQALDSYVQSFTEYASVRLDFQQAVRQLSLIYTEVKPKLLVVSKNEVDKRASALAAAQMTAEDGFSTVTTIAVILIVVLAVISRVIISITIAPIRALEASLMAVADGDYDAPIAGVASKSEIGTMAKVAEKLRDSAKERLRLEMVAMKEVTRKADAERENAKALALQNARELEDQKARQAVRAERTERLNRLISRFDSSLAEAMINLQTASADMRGTADVMLDIAEETGNQSQSLRVASQSMQDHTSETLNVVEQFSSSIHEVNSQVIHASKISDQAVKASEDGSASINQLSESSRQIEDVVKLINDIAEQTNLLALNATIEAARAGDAGKGFAVVASEVKSLANQTAKATDDITGQIKEMQRVTGTAVETVGSIGGTIESLNEIMVSITSAVEEQQAATAEINRSIHHASENTSKVSNEITAVSEGADKTGSESTKVISAAEQLEALSRLIKSEVEVFLQDVQSIQQETDESADALSREQTPLRLAG